MLSQSTYKPRQQAIGALRNRDHWFRMLLILITLVSVGTVVLPTVMPLLTTASPSIDNINYSHATKASALVAYVLLWVSMLAGLSITGKTARRWPGMSWSFGLHRFTTLLGLGFAVVHALVLLSDRYMDLSIGQLLVPFMAGSYKPQWLGLGQVALYSLAAVALSFYVRKRLGMRTWRLIHSLSFALFLMALIHGLQSGSDSGLWWARVLYWISAGTVLAGSVYRVWAARSGRPRERAAATGLVVVGGRTQASLMPRAPQSQGVSSGRMNVSAEQVLVRQ